MSYENPHWQRHAACRGADPELFFPIGSTGPAVRQADQAKAVCAGCPAREACLGYAMDRKLVGVWGGTTDEERARLHRNQLRRTSRERSTPAA